MSDATISFAYGSFALIAVSMVVDGLLAYNGKESINLTEVVIAGLAWFAGVYVSGMVAIITSYFARRSDDKRTATAIAAEMPIPPGTGIMGTIAARLLKR